MYHSLGMRLALQGLERCGHWLGACIARTHEMDDLMARTAGAADGGEYELFKTTSIFDATAKNPDWLGEEPDWVKAAV